MIVSVKHDQREKPNNLKLVQRTKVLIHNKLADKAKARLPTFLHNLHLVVCYIFLILNNVHQITTCRLFDSILCCSILRNAPHFFVSTSAIPVNRYLTECDFIRGNLPSHGQIAFRESMASGIGGPGPITGSTKNQGNLHSCRNGICQIIATRRIR